MRQHRIRLLAAAPVLAVLLGVLSACGEPESESTVPSAGGTAAPSATPSGGSSEYAQSLAFANCMRDNGLPDFPDPDPNAADGLNLGGTTIDRGSTQFKNAMEACQDLLPAGSEKAEANTEQIAQMTKYAECMRKNGLPDFADPGPGGFDPGGWNTDDPAFKTAADACKELLTWR